MGDAFECAAKRASKKGTQGNFTGFARIVATSAAGNMVERAGGQASRSRRSRVREFGEKTGEGTVSLLHPYSSPLDQDRKYFAKGIYATGLRP